MELRVKMMLSLWAMFLVLGACEDSFDGTVARGSSVKKDSMGFTAELVKAMDKNYRGIRDLEKSHRGIRDLEKSYRGIRDIFLSIKGSIKKAGMEGSGIQGDSYRIRTVTHRGSGLSVKESIKKAGMEGSGTQEDPYQIRTVAHLTFVRSNIQNIADRNYKLMNDLDFEGVSNFHSIGHGLWMFQGTFDGNGKKIKNLKIDEESLVSVGLFQYIGSRGLVKNLRLENIRVQGKTYVGGIAGVNEGNIIGSHVEGRVLAFNRVSGGLVGLNKGMITGSSTSGRIMGESYVGGFAGWNHKGKILRSHSSAKVSGRNFVGGLVGANFHKIVNISQDKSNMDRIILVEMSDTDENIKKSYATGSVAGKNAVGGLVGWNFKAAIKDSHAGGNVKAIGSGNSWIGGLVGWNYGQIYDSYAAGDIKGVSNIGGGLVGLNVGTILNSHARGAVEGVKNVGGLVGWHGKLNFNLSKRGTGSELKSFFGESRSHWLLAGYRGGSHDEESYIGNSRASGSVTGTKNVGHLVGYRVQGRDTTIKDSVGTGSSHKKSSSQ